MCAAVLAAVVVAGGLPGVAEAAAKPGNRLILAPKPKQRLPARPVLVKVRAPGDVHRFRVQLNGTEIERHFSGPHHGVRHLEASLSHGLKHGHNRLHVRVGKRTQGMRFYIRHGVHLVGAGFDRTVPVGAKVFLEGHHKLPGHRPVIAGAAASAHYHWKTVAGPKHHDLGGGQSRNQPTHSHTPTPEFRPTVPGRYTLRLTVTTGNGTSASDTADVVANPVPAVAIDTMAPPSNGETLTHIQVGSESYPAVASDPFEVWAQLVALDRKTLVPVSGKLADLANKTYTCSNQADCSQNLSSDLARLGPDTLAIVANPYPPGAVFNGVCNPADSEVPVGLEGALKGIGVSTTGFDDQPSNRCSVGGISAIGVPGTAPGHGDWHSVATSSQMGAGRMQGYLVRDNALKYTYMPSDRVDFDTQAPGSSDSQNVMQVGTKTFTQSFPGGILDGGGFQVLVLDAQSLDGNSYWFETDHSDKAALAGQLTAMRQLLHDANTADGQHQKVVVIASLGDPAIQYYKRSSLTTPDDEINTDLSQLVDEVEQLGGTRNAFYKMLDPALYADNGYSYTLLADGNSGPGQGEEAVRTGITGAGTGPLNTAPMSGVLGRGGPNSRFEVQGSPQIGGGAAGGDPTRGVTEMTGLAFQQKVTPWPEQDPAVFPNADERARKKAAIAWVGKNTQDLGTNDPRGQYWTRALVKNQFDYNGWDHTAFQIQGLKYPGQGVGFTSDDLDWAKAELAGPLTNPPLVGGEIGWLEATHRYLDKLATPFDQTQFKSWAALQDIADKVRNDVATSPDKAVQANAGAVFDFGRALLEELPLVGKAFKVSNLVYDLAANMTEINNEPADDNFPSTLGTIGTDLAKRLDAEGTALTLRLPNVIAADYGKLKAVGACASRDQQNCPFDINDWQYGSDDQTKAAQDLYDAGQVWAYGQVVPAQYSLYKLPPWWRTTVGDNHDFFAPSRPLLGYPFFGLPANAQVAKPIYRNIPSYSHQFKNCTLDPVPCQSTGDSWQISALGFLKSGNGTFFNPWEMGYPQASVMKDLFDPASKNGLGADPEKFFDIAFLGDKTKPLVNFPYQDITPGWRPNN
jgi:hypothetical protein